ncbi:MAG: N-acetylneuraminate synthase [Candidatus Omnitrophica bacterium]|nr:N-acetylneuraminate synthase [Candidatus Omnitrophota bacterium]
MYQKAKNKKIFIIAEAGVNHNGDIRMARRMVDAARDAGADAVKFQTFVAKALVTSKAPQAAYQRKNAQDVSQQSMLKKLELPFPAFRELAAYCRKRRIMFLSTPFDSTSARFLFELAVPFFKISSGDLNNVPFLTEIARYRRPIILSTGMSTLKEVGTSVRAILKAGNRRLTLLQCTTDYPSDYSDVNLRAMATLSQAFGLPVGLSDHTPGIEIAVAAAALGAVVIEKHFTLDKSLPGPDHLASLDPVELSALVNSVRHVEAAMGDGKKSPCRAELGVMAVARKSLVAARDIPVGTLLGPEDVVIKRPGTGIAPGLLDSVVGHRARRAIAADTLISWKDIAQRERRR